MKKQPPVPHGKRWSQLSIPEKEAMLSWNTALALEAKESGAIIRPVPTKPPAKPAAKPTKPATTKPAPATKTKPATRTTSKPSKATLHRAESDTMAGGVRVAWISMTAGQRASVQRFDPTLAATMARAPAWAWRLRPEALTSH